MFVTVRYGDDQSRLFNINCRNEVLLYQIKKRCKMDRDEIIDLSDEHGTVKNLRQNLNEYGFDYLKERETLILLRVDLSNADHLEEDPSLLEKAVFVPMLTTLNENQDFIDKLHGRHPGRHHGVKYALNPRDHMGSKHSLIDEDTKNRKPKNKEKKKDKKQNKPPPPKK